MLILLSKRAFSFLSSVGFFNRLQKYQLSLPKKMFAEIFEASDGLFLVYRFNLQQEENLNSGKRKIIKNE